jgi:hypothetical protein
VGLDDGTDQEVGKADVNSIAPPETLTPILASDILQRLHDAAPNDQFTLGWVLGTLHTRSFGIILLLCAVVAMLPGVSIIAGLLLMMIAAQMIAGRSAPVFPAGITARPLPARHLAAVLNRAIPALRYLEQVTHPRWLFLHEATKRTVGIAVLILSIAVVFIPLPLGNIPPAMVIALIAIAYLEHDGLLLVAGLITGLILLTIEVVVAKDAVADVGRLFGL